MRAFAFLALAAALACAGCRRGNEISGSWEGHMTELPDVPYQVEFKSDGQYELRYTIASRKPNSSYLKYTEAGTYTLDGNQVEFSATTSVASRYDAAGTLRHQHDAGPYHNSAQLEKKDADHISLKFKSGESNVLDLTRRVNP